MYCPKCGGPDQVAETFCRKCGFYVPDVDKLAEAVTRPEVHVIANNVLSMMTVVASLTLAALLYAFFFGREDTHILIYVTAGFLIAIAAWNVQVFIRGMKLRAQVRSPRRDSDVRPEIGPAVTARLPGPDVSSFGQNITKEGTTKELHARRGSSPQAKQ